MIFNTSIFFVSVLFLICAAITAAERGSSLQRRRTSIGNRPSVAPVMPGDDDDDDDNGDDDYGNGKGGGKGDGKGNGYNSGISKSSKKSKSKKSVEDGKGMYMSMQIEMEEGRGDGKGYGKGAKSEKSYKSYDSKKSKNDKGYYYYGHGKNNSPASQPSAGPPGTNSPTSVDSIPVKSSPYAITYSPSSCTPASTDCGYNELTSATQNYLEGYMEEFFAQTALTDIDNFLTTRVREVFIEDEPVMVVFESNGLFDPDSIFIPVTKEINNLIEEAIASEEYLELLGSLSTSSFSETESITFSIVEEESTANARSSTTKNSSSSYVRAGVAAAAAGVVVLAASLAMMKSKRARFVDDEDQTLSPRKSSLEESTIAGETCNMSLNDSSDHFRHWRTRKAYNDTDEHEFEDEPLDSDDE